MNLTPYLSFWSGSELGSDYNGNIFMSTDIEWQTANSSSEENQQLLNALANLPNQTASSTSSTYNLYEDQVTIAGEVYTDAIFKVTLIDMLLTSESMVFWSSRLKTSLPVEPVMIILFPISSLRHFGPTAMWGMIIV